MLRLLATRRFSRATSHLRAKVNPLVYPNPDWSLYEGAVGVEFEHVRTVEEKNWLYEEYESLMKTPISPAQQLNLLRELMMGEVLERFLHKKYGTFKRYSGEGMECLVPSLWSVCKEYGACKLPNSEAVLTMHHRGKLAVLVSLLNFPARNLFWKIEGNSDLPEELNREQYYFMCDIPTHLCTSVERRDMDGLRLTSLHNPSHLEINGPVGLGKTRAKQDQGHNALHIWVHGDAAVAGQGVVYEATQTVQLPNYSTAGGVHIITNNQVGFTTPQKEARSGRYTTEVFKITGAPIVHVNGLCPEEIQKMGQLAVRYRQKFQNDAVIELMGYRKYGHNEVDEPAFTNPLMYKVIRGQMKGCASDYADKLVAQGKITSDVTEKMKAQLESYLQSEYEKRLEAVPNVEAFTAKDTRGSSTLRGHWAGFQLLEQKSPTNTGYNTDRLKHFAEVSVTLPTDFAVHPVLKNGHIKNRLEHVRAGLVDWATAEAMAFGSVLDEGHCVRLSGQDSIRGTFSQRHAAFYCQNTETPYYPFKHHFPNAHFNVCNSPLSEMSILGFEYGYSLNSPDSLILWEAQFGDFANMAQPIIDLYIASGEAKWLRQSGLVMLLPHGQEGMGPDHSSARLERFLQLVTDPIAARTNMAVYCPVSPANYFHILRGQVLADFRRPVIIAAPKSGLRHKLALSTIEEFQPNTSFKPVLVKEVGSGSADTVLLCSGKVYLDILSNYPKRNFKLIAIEQLAPFPLEALKQAIGTGAKQLVWVQEEPKNQGCWGYVQELLLPRVSQSLACVSLPPLSGPAVGNSVDFKKLMAKLMKDVEKYLG